jgi:hypothetical protein
MNCELERIWKQLWRHDRGFIYDLFIGTEENHEEPQSVYPDSEADAFRI